MPECCWAIWARKSSKSKRRKRAIRSAAGAASNTAPPFGSVNRNKKSVAIDLKDPKGLAAVRDLMRSADVVIENFRPGTLDRLGLAYEQASKDNPQLIWCSITGFGNPTALYAIAPGL